MLEIEAKCFNSGRTKYFVQPKTGFFPATFQVAKNVKRVCFLWSENGFSPPSISRICQWIETSRYLPSSRCKWPYAAPPWGSWHGRGHDRKECAQTTLCYRDFRWGWSPWEAAVKVRLVPEAALTYPRGHSGPQVNAKAREYRDGLKNVLLLKRNIHRFHLNLDSGTQTKVPSELGNG